MKLQEHCIQEDRLQLKIPVQGKKTKVSTIRLEDFPVVGDGLSDIGGVGVLSGLVVAIFLEYPFRPKKAKIEEMRKNPKVNGRQRGCMVTKIPY